MDFAQYDLCDVFKVSDVASAWAKDINNGDRKLLFLQLKDAIQRGELKIDEEEFIFTYGEDMPTNFGQSTVRRAELTAWFEKKDFKPKFLFPEAREQEPTNPPVPVQTSELSKKRYLHLIATLAALVADQSKGQKLGTVEKPNALAIYGELCQLRARQEQEPLDDADKPGNSINYRTLLDAIKLLKASKNFPDS